jgi:hypothetical protein
MSTRRMENEFAQFTEKKNQDDSFEEDIDEKLESNSQIKADEIQEDKLIPE